MLNLLRTFRQKSILKIALFGALMLVGGMMWGNVYIWHEKADATQISLTGDDKIFEWNSIFKNDTADQSIWKKRNENGTWGYLNETPDIGSGDNILFSGEVTAAVKLTRDITINELILGYEQTGSNAVTSGRFPTTIDLNGHKLICSKLILNNNGTYPVTLIITDSSENKGSFTVNTEFDFSDTQDHKITINNGANFIIASTATIKGSSSTDTGTVTINTDDNGNLDINGTVENDAAGIVTNSVTVSGENANKVAGNIVWNGSAGDSKWETGTNWTPADPAFSKAISVTIPNNCSTYPVIENDKEYKIKTLAIESDASITLSNGNLTLTSTTTPLTNYGTIIFTDTGRIYNNATTPALIMDNTNGTVQYGTGTDTSSGTISNYGDTDYNKLVIASGTWTIATSGNNIKADRFAVESSGKVIMNNTAEIAAPCTNKGTIEVKAGTEAATTQVAIWNDFINEGTVILHNNSILWIAGSSSKVEDSGSWTFGNNSKIALNIQGSNFIFSNNSAAAASNKYVFEIFSATNKSITLSGYNAANPMQIISYTDTATDADKNSTSAQILLNNVKFLDDTIFNNKIASGTTGNIEFAKTSTFNKDFTTTAGALTFKGDVLLNKGITISATTADNQGKDILIDTGVTVTAKVNFKITKGKLLLKGTVNCNNGTPANSADDVDFTAQSISVQGNASITAKAITIGGSITPDVTDIRDLELIATNGNISIGSSTNPNTVEIGTDALKFHNITLSTITNDITFEGNSNIKASNQVSVTGKNITFSGATIADALIVNAQQSVKLQPGSGDSDVTPKLSLRANSLTVNGVNGSTPAITYSGTIDLSAGAADFTIDRAVTINGDTHFNIGGNFVLALTGSITPDTAGNHTVQITAKTGKNIQLKNNVATTAKKFSQIVFNSPIEFNEAHTINALTTDFAENCSGITVTNTSKPHYTISDSLIVRSAIAFPDDSVFVVPGNFTNKSAPSFPKKLEIKGNFTDEGTWTATSVPDIYLTGTQNQSFNGKTNSTYQAVTINQANNTTASVEFKDTTGFAITNLTVTNSSNVIIDTNLKIGTADSENDFTNSTCVTTVTKTGSLKAKNVTLAAVNISNLIETSEEQTITGTITVSENSELKGAKLTLPTAVNLNNATSNYTLTLSSANINGTTTFAPDVIMPVANTTFTGSPVFKKTLKGNTTTNNSLIITGNVQFDSDVSDFAELEIQGTANLNNETSQSIITTGKQTFSDNIEIKKLATLNASEILLNKTDEKQTISGTDASLTLNIENLTVSQTSEVSVPVTLADAIGITNSDSKVITFKSTTGTSNYNITNTGSIIFDDILVNSPVVNNGIISCTGNVTFKEEYKPSTDNTFNAGSGTVTFNKNIDFSKTTFNAQNGTVVLEPADSETISLTGSGSQSYNTLQIKGNAVFTSSNTFVNLEALELENKTIIFPAGDTKVQSITGTLKLTGKADEDGKRLILRSSSAASTDMNDCFFINFTGTVNEESPYSPLIQNVDMKNGYNVTGEPSGHTYLTVRASEDSGNNYFWNFAGLEYIWTGKADTNWFNKSNWNRNSVPAMGTDVIIPADYESAQISNWPALSKADFPAGTHKVSVGNKAQDNNSLEGTINVEEGALFDLCNESLSTGTITNNGLVRIQGIENQSISGTMKNGENSTVEYYSVADGKTVNLLWDGNATSPGHQFNRLLITGEVDISEAAYVTDTTEINTSKDVSLTGENIFRNGLNISEGGEVLLNSANGFVLTQKADSQLTTLTVNSNVVLASSITVKENQTFNGDLEAEKALTLTQISDTGKITFTGEVTGAQLFIDGNTHFANGSNLTSDYVKIINTKERTWTSETKANLTTDLYVDCGTNTINLNGNLTATNIYMYNGNVTIGTSYTIESTKNFVVWGANYSAVDKRYSSSNIRFEYYKAEPFAYSINPENASTTFGELKGNITVNGNFYLNGTDLPSLKLNIPDNSKSNPVLNITDKTTETQWGLPYAVTFNSEISGVTVNGGWLNAATAQGNKDNTGNTNIQFQVPQITKAYTVYDDVIYIAFNMPLENSNNEINTNLAKGTKLSEGGLWYNNKSYRFASVAYKDADCSTPLNISEDITKNAADEYGFYLRTIHDEDDTGNPSTYWNTDADGKHPYSVSGTTAADSTDRNGYHHNITVDLSLLEGLFTAADGHTMSNNYGINYEADGITQAEAYSDTEDYCEPVLIAVYIGQENHEDNPSDQEHYDAHNFIELRYSEPVNIGDGITTLNATAGDTNVQATTNIGEIKGNGTILNTANEGLQIEGLAEFATGKLISANKNDSSSPHALYRTFTTKAGGTAENQTHRIRLSIAGFVDGEIDSHKNWVGYIDYAKAPETGTTVNAIENLNILDLKNNILDIKGEPNHKNNNAFKLNAGIPNETLNPIYGTWDTLPPVFSTLIKAKTGQSKDEYEILPTGNGTVINKIELHILDGDYSEENKYFVFSHGWAEKLPSADPVSNYLYQLIPTFQAADKFGGSRAFAGETERTSGGIRYCSIINQQSAFKFTDKPSDSPNMSFNSIKTGATANYFSGTNDNAYPIPQTDDNLYISLGIPNSSFNYETTFNLSYDNSSSFITDLAGNRLKSHNNLKSIDRTPPDYSLTLAPIGTNDIYIIFTKTLETTNVKIMDNMGEYHSRDTLYDVLPEIIKFGTINGGWQEDSNMKIVSAQEFAPFTVFEDVNKDKEFTGVKLTLENPITLEDVTTKYMRIEFPAGMSETGTDAFTNLIGSRVTYIQSNEGTTYMQMYKAHPISDFAVNAINLEYAYDPDYTADDGTYMMRTPTTEDDTGSWAVHSWGKNQGNFGTLPYNEPVNIIANRVTADQTYTMYLANNPDAQSVSVQFNTDFDDSKRIWLPEIAGNSPFVPLADALNTKFETLTETSDIDFDATETPNRTEYKITKEDITKFNWHAGDQIKFLFSLDGQSIMHTPSNSNDGKSYTGIYSPIFALRTESLAMPDVTTLDLWSFRLKDYTYQRGGVSIFNNVINVAKAEKTIIKVNMPKDGKLKVIVMTLDGNVIDYLENSNNATSGEHVYYWNGTNRNHNMVARGMYFIRVIGDGLDETRKVMCVNEK